jgi:CheY-like chemotaxis protein
VARVLLVNDDIAEISAVKRVLARGGHQPVLATNAQDALASLQQARPDLVLIGATCEGGDALRRIAADDAGKAVRVVILGEVAGAPAGAASVARPIDPGQLADTVAASLAVGPPRPPAARKAPPTRAVRPAPANGPAAADPAAARKAAAEALRARAAELRRTTVPVLEATPEPGPPAAAPAARPAPVAAASQADLDDSGIEAILRRAEQAERAHAAEKSARARQADRATVEAAQRAEAEKVAVEKASRARAAEDRARVEKRARAEAERKAAHEVAARERAERERRAAEEKARREAEEEARRAAEAEGRARTEEDARRAAEAKARTEAEGRRRAESQRRAAESERRAAEERARRGVDEGARRAEQAEGRARAEADARKRLEDELDQLRSQVETERRSAEERIQSVMERAEAEERASEDLRRLAEEEAQRRNEEEAQRRQSEEEQLRAAIASARAEMDSLRKRGEEEARLRAQAEAEAARLAREVERRAAEAAAQPAPFDLPVYRPPAEDPEPDPGEEAARRRVAALRGDPEPPAAAPARPPEPPPAAEAASPRRALRTPPPELRSGTLADVPAPRLLALAARAAATGRLELEGEVARSVWLEDGRVVGAGSADPSERVEELALRLGLVTRDQHRQIAAAAATLSTRRAALLLLERGFLKPTELTQLVRRRTEEVVFGVFADAGARYRWAAEEVPPEERTTLERGSLALAVEGVRRRWLAPQVDAVLGGAGTLLAPIAAGPGREELALSPEEQRAVALADGLRTLDEIVAASPIDPLSTRQVLAALVLVGALGVRMFQGGKPAAAATTAIDLARVREKLDQVRRADYFTILGVGRLCTPHEVRQAAERLQAEFEPRRYQGIREDGLPGRLDEILRVVADAREILVDDRLRSEYLRGLGEER